MNKQAEALFIELTVTQVVCMILALGVLYTGYIAIEYRQEVRTLKAQQCPKTAALAYVQQHKEVTTYVY
jgi:hypothetical protein